MTYPESQVHISASGDVFRNYWRVSRPVVSLTLIILGIAVISGLIGFGSFAAALSAVRGDTLLVDEPFKSINDIRPGSRVTLSYGLTNASNHPITLLGMNGSCSCVATDDLPVKIASSETRFFTVTVKTRAGESLREGSIWLYTDTPGSSEILLSYRLGFAPPR
jgi:hypothetical protein